MKVKDYSISGEEFELLYRGDLMMLETFPQPTLKNLPKYYLSENYISHSDNKRNFFEIVYHLVKVISLRRKLRIINSSSPKEKNLLDSGCGTGDFLLAAKKNNWNVIGIEPNEKARKIANRKTNNAVFGVEHIQKLKPHYFDVITLWHVLEHIPKYEDYLSLLKKLLKPEGTLIIAVPNFKSYDAHFYKNYWAGYDVPRHLWHFSKESISKLAKRQDMEVVKILPLFFDAYYVSLLSEKYKHGIMNPIKGLFVGWYSNLKAKRNGEYSSLIYLIKNRQETFLGRYLKDLSEICDIGP